jgi:hypothetical protein
MSFLCYKGIAWEVNGFRDGKSILTYRGTSIVYDQAMEVFQFRHGRSIILARTLRQDVLRDATHCILDVLAEQFVPLFHVQTP